MLPRTLASAVVASLVSLVVAACGSGTSASPAPTAGPPTALPTLSITAEPTLPEDSQQPAETPSRAEAYEQLLVSSPPTSPPSASRARRPRRWSRVSSARPIGDLPNGGLGRLRVLQARSPTGPRWTRFSARSGRATRTSARRPGRAAERGPGEGTWEQGRKDCYSFFDDANVMWTYDELYIFADAFNDKGDYAKLEQFWTTAGPVTP